MGDVQLWGAWGDWVERGRLMLVFGGAGGSGQANHRRAINLAAFGMPEGPPLMPEGA